MTREESITYLEDAKSDLPYKFEQALNMAIEALSKPKIGWIPVSERLPEIGQKVLASTKRTVFTQVYKGIYSEPNVWHWEHNSIKVVIAWMPLPPVYQGE